MRFPAAMIATPIFSLRRQLLSRPRWGSPISGVVVEATRAYVGNTDWRITAAAPKAASR
jgi:hypothetical protein